MKNLIFLILIAMNGCGDIVSQSSCGNPYFEHRSLEEIAAMTPEEKMDQMVLEQMFHIPALDDYRDLLHLYIIDDGIKILPKAIEYLNGYDPNTKECKKRNDARLLTAAMYIDGVDTAKFRIRAIENGRVAIKALEQAIERRNASLDPDEYNGRRNLLSVFLNGLKGRTIKDGLIEKTLETRHNVKMSDAELTEFTNFLISLDPAYPSWTKVLGWAEMSQPESDRYYQAYLKFRKTKK